MSKVSACESACHTLLLSSCADDVATGGLQLHSQLGNQLERLRHQELKYSDPLVVLTPLIHNTGKETAYRLLTLTT